MRPYLAVFRARWRALLTYRGAAFAGFLTQWFWGWLRITILDAFFRGAPADAAPIAIAQVHSYVWLSQATFALLSFNVEGELTEKVRTGNVAIDLLRPVGLFGNWFARAVALRTAPTLLRAVPLLAMAALWGGLRPPPDVAHMLLWIASIAAAVLLSAAITAAVSVTLLWNLAAEGVRAVLFPLVWVLSGLLMPLPLFPDWMQPLIHVLPFRAMMDVPCRIWSGHIGTADAIGEIGLQLAWAAAIGALGMALAARGARRLAVAGG